MGCVMCKPQKVCTIWGGMTQLLQVQEASLLSYSKKNPNREVEDMEFPRVSKKWHVEFPGVN